MKQNFKRKWRIKNLEQPRRESVDGELSKSTMSSTPTNANIAEGGI
jgi:hypothetical protein